MSDQKGVYPPSPLEIQYRRLDRYLERLRKEGMGWKDVVAGVANFHRKNEPDNPYTSQTFYDPAKSKNRLK